MLKRVNVIQDNCYVGYINAHGNTNIDNVKNAATLLFIDDDEKLFLLNDYDEDKFIGTILNLDRTETYYKIIENGLEPININKNDINWDDYLTHNKSNLIQEDEIDPYDMAL